ncbi:MAG: small multi-drug export protein [Lachnospiraceae bacterium]|nr:small multi-drug export protein [Lachnospiraceae bacterium]
MESLVTWFVNSPLGQHVSREALVFIISLFPILELRGGILAASLLDVTMWKGILISAIGNFVPIPFILLFIKKIFAFLRRFRLFRPLVDALENRAMKKKGQVEKYEFWGLVLFVGIPLPVTGAWTGSLVAALLNMDIKKAIRAELLGICMAAVIMTIISYGIIGSIIR